VKKLTLILFVLCSTNLFSEEKLPKPNAPRPHPPTVPDDLSAEARKAKEEARPVRRSFSEAPKVKNDAADIYLNFENASLESVVNYLAEQRKINFIPHKGLANKKVSLTTREPLTLKRAWNVLLTLLEMNNFSIINVGDVYRIVPSNTNKKEPLPFYSSRRGTQPEDLPDSDMVVRYVYVLSNMSTASAQRILSDLLGRNKVQSNKDLATCIITDKCYNIKYAMKIIKELDKGGLREAIKIIKLRFTEAQEVAELFSKNIMEQRPRRPLRIFGPKEQKEITYFSNTTKIIPEKRQNSLILLGLEQNINKVIAFIRKYIDVPMDNAESRIHIKELKYVNAKIIKPIIEKMTTPPKGRGKSPLVGEFKFFEDVKVHAEDPEVGKGNDKESRGSGNRLIIACNKDDWRRLEKLIDKLDKPQPQVALEVMIVDIDGETARKLGTQIREKTGKSLLKGMTPFTANLAAIEVNTNPGEGETKKDYNADLGAVAAGPQGTTSITAGRQGDIWLVIKSFLSRTGTNIIEQPFMVTSNNKKCVQIVEQTKRVPGKLITEGEQQYRKIEEISARTQIELTPRINVSGLVDLQIKIDLSEFAGTGAADTPTRTEREIVTRMSVGTGEVIVIGGLTKGQVIDHTYKTPLLGDIPIIGNLFKGKTKSRTKTNLYLFIRPSIIKPQFKGSPDDYTRLKLDYAKYQIFNVEGIRRTKDPIQRWFFKPEKQTVKERLADIKAGVHRPIDNYAEGKYQPRSVRIERDPHYRTSEAIEKLKKREEAERKKKKAFKQRSKYLLPSLRKKK
jgi:general secretion pathway protein D